MSKVLIIDPQPLVFEGCKIFFSKYMPDLHAQTVVYDDSVDQLYIAPDVCLVILGLYGELNKTAEFQNKIHELNPGIPVIIYYGDISAEDMKDFVKKSTKGYLSKRQKSDALITCIRQVLKGETYIGGEMSQSITAAWQALDNT